MKAESIEIIEKFLDDKMDREEKEEFKLKMIIDSDFGILYNILKDLIKGIRNTAKRTTLEEKLRKLEWTDK